MWRISIPGSAGNVINVIILFRTRLHFSHPPLIKPFLLFFGIYLVAIILILDIAVINRINNDTQTPISSKIRQSSAGIVVVPTAHQTGGARSNSFFFFFHPSSDI